MLKLKRVVWLYPFFLNYIKGMPAAATATMTPEMNMNMNTEIQDALDWFGSIERRPAVDIERTTEAFLYLYDRDEVLELFGFAEVLVHELQIYRWRHALRGQEDLVGPSEGWSLRGQSSTERLEWRIHDRIDY
jgi:hypothetical protein